MKRNLVLAAVFALVAFAMTAAAQKAPNFSGTWNLDVSKSKLGDNNRIESQTLTVAQTSTDIKITTSTKRTPPPAGAPTGGGGGGRMGGGGGDQTVSYTFGKETKVDMTMGQNTVPVTYNSKWDGGKLNLSSSRTMTNQAGDTVSMTSKETWELGSDGKTLTINRESTSPRGTNSTTSVFNKAQ
jgi:hypothetical protein